MSNCTVVTAFFNFDKKKHHTIAYFQWINNYLPTIDAPMIIFTDENSKSILIKMREKFIDKTKIITLNLTDFYTYQYLSHWNKDILRDHEKNYHNIELYMIWNEKFKFLDRAIDINPFNTDFFIWTDIGMVREKYYIDIIKSFPNNEKIEKLNKNKIYLLNIDNYLKEEDYNVKLPTEKYRFVNCIGGGVIFGHKNILRFAIQEYYSILENMMQNDLFAGKDQSVLANLCLKNRNLVELIIPEKSPLNNDWFYMLYYFSC